MISSLFSGIGSLAPALANHLWQSTAFAGGIGLLVLLFRKNRARVRYGLWLAASLKFLIPFSLLIGLGGVLPQRHSSGIPAQPAVSTAVDAVSQPFTGWETTMPGPSAQNSQERMLALLPPTLFLAWLCGALIVMLVWCARWREARAMLRRSTPAEDGRELEVLRRVERRAGMRRRTQLCLSDDLMEPGIFGVFRPVLLWPRKLSERLEEDHFEGVLIHEVMHVRRRDNLTAAFHMAVEVIFWFHPLVWWIERQLLDERERACDEAVMQFGGQAGLYAESLLKVSRFCTEPPLHCVSGITGANLSTRIRAVMAPHFRELSLSKKILLSMLAVLALAAPIFFGQPQEPLQFEVATLKPAPDGVLPALTPRKSGDRFTWTTWLQLMLPYAYSIPFTRIEGFNFDGQIYSVTAKIDPSATDEQARQMLQALLVERLKIVAHRETKETQGYALVIAKNGTKLKPADPSGEPPPMPDFMAKEPVSSIPGRIIELSVYPSGSGVVGRGVSMAELADKLSDILKEAVVDRTGLTAKYYFDFEFQPDNTPSIQNNRDTSADVPMYPSIFSVLPSKLGLKLEKAKVPAEFLVVEHSEKLGKD